VPAEVDRRRRRHGEPDPQPDLPAPPEPEQVGRDRCGEAHRDVQRGEARDALRSPGRGVAQELEPLVEQDVLQPRDLRGGQADERSGLGEDRPQGRQQEVARRAQHPVDRLRRGVEQPRLQVAREDQREADRQRQEDDEGDVRRREEVRLQAGAQQVVHQRARIAAPEHAAIELRQLAVEQLPRPEQRDDALEVAIGEVGRVEADQRGADGDSARERPALAPDAPQRRPRRREAARGARCADQDVEPDQHQHPEADERQVERGDVIGIAQRQADRVGDQQRRHDGPGGHRRAGQRAAPAGGGGPRHAGVASGAERRLMLVRSTPVRARARRIASAPIARPPRSSTT
jgi:hypothetical protein